MASATQGLRGTVLLMTAAHFLMGLAQRRTVGFTTLQLSFVPEPGALLLLAAAAVGGLGLVRGRGEP